MKADILACYDNTWVDKLIRWVTKNKITHNALVISDQLIMESCSAGVKLSKLSSRKGKYYVLRCKSLTKEQAEKIVEFAELSVDTPYDIKLFIGTGLNRIFGLKTNWNDPKRYNCTELIIEAYKSVGIDLLPGMVNPLPYDMEKSPFLVRVDKEKEKVGKLKMAQNRQ